MKAAGTRPDLLLACPTQLGLFCAFRLVVGDEVEIVFTVRRIIVTTGAKPDGGTRVTFHVPGSVVQVW